MATPQQIYDIGEPNELGPANKEAKVGTILAGEEGVRLVREKAAKVANNAIAPRYRVVAMLAAEVRSGSSGNGVKAPQGRGATVAANSVAPNADGTSIALTAAEVAGADAVADIVYLTFDAPKGAAAMTADIGGVALCGAVAGLFFARRKARAAEARAALRRRCSLPLRLPLRQHR